MPWLNPIISVLAASILATFTALIKHLYGRQKVQAAQQEYVKEGMLALMHDRIFSIYGECHKKSYASIEELRNLEYLYKPYHELGGNGTGTELYDRIKKMPPEPIKTMEENHEN